MSAQNIIIIGGGFAGVRCARELRRRLPKANISLFSRQNHMVFQPLLADVAGSSLNPRAVAATLRQLLPGVHCRNEEVIDVDADHNQVVIRKYNGESESLAYDHLVIAAGSRVNLDLVPGMLSHALPLKTIGDAIAMRAHVMTQLDRADACTDLQEKRWLLSFVVVGGGFSGVEVAGEINDLARHSAKYFPRIQADDICVSLVHAGEQILPEVSESLRLFAQKRMQKAGVKLELNQRATRVNERGVLTNTGERLDGASVICTIGTEPTALVAGLDFKKHKGRLATEPEMRIPGTENIWAIGDCAWIPNAYDGETCPPTAQFAERQGKQLAKNIHAVIKGKKAKPFHYKSIGVACGIGGRKGVAELYGVRISGFIAWWLWRSAFLIKLPSFLQKMKVGFEWAWEVIFPRDLSYFSGLRTQAVGQAYFGPGETIIESTKPRQALFAIEEGECEVIYRDKVISILGSNELFSSKTLKSYGDDSVKIRARNEVQLVTIADDFLLRISKALKPVQALLIEAEYKYHDLWGSMPNAHRVLEAAQVDDVMSPFTGNPFKPDDPLRFVFLKIRHCPERVFPIIDESGLIGVVTRTDLLNGLTQGPDCPIRDIMNSNPMVVHGKDSLLLAANTMHEASLKCLPVCETGTDKVMTGMLHSDDIAAFILAKTNPEQSNSKEENQP